MTGNEFVPRPLTEREIAAEYATGTPFDLTACVTEKIHLLGRVQSHGALVAVDESTGAIRVVSDNVGDLLGRPAGELLAGDLGLLLDADQRDQVARLAETLSDGGSAFVCVRVTGVDRDLDLTVHRGDGLLICEFEPAGRPTQFTHLYAMFRSATQRLQGRESVSDVCAAAVHEIRRLTGYARVVAYRFDGDGPGQVVAEEIADGLEPWLGLWFPATDVPPQARRLYLHNWIRVIVDVEDPGAELTPRTLDLSGSALRTVSPFHIEYLRNIGVRSSMSVSLIHNGALWGLIACHGSGPTTLGPEQRAACEMFGIALSLQLAALEQHQTASAEASARRAMVRVLADAADDLPDGLVTGSPNLLDLMPADGAVARIGGRTAAVGRLPDPDALLAVVDRLTAEGTVVSTAGEPWATDRLGELAPAAAAMADLASGVLVLPLSPAGDVVVWCRGEASRDVRWATDPSRPVVTSRYGHRLTPRGSSAVWRQTVRGRSTPWTVAERAVAGDLWRAVSGIVLRRAAELADLNQSLRATNTELQAFAHVVSHDLKEPLRGIAHAAAFIAEDAGDGLDPTTEARLDTIGRLAVRMDDLLNAVMRYATLGRSDLDRAETDLDAVLDDVLDTLATRVAEQGATVRRAGRLPTVVGDRVRLYEVLQNLVANAVKYAAVDRPPVVEVGAATVVPPGGDRPAAAVYVRDNGVGIDAGHHEEVFLMFRRLRGDRETAGSGVGLAIARRIVERHGGQLWLESEPGTGSTFWFTV